jgi:hypothetical protein
MCVINGCWRPFSSIIAGIAGRFLMKSLRVNLIDGAWNSILFLNSLLHLCTPCCLAVLLFCHQLPSPCLFYRVCSYFFLDMFLRAICFGLLFETIL